MGFMVGSLNKVWPWKDDPKGLIQHNVSPGEFEMLHNGEPSLLLEAILLCVVGFLTIYGIERLALYVQHRRKA